MKLLFVLTSLLGSLYSSAALEEGLYIGTNEKTGGQCSLNITDEGSCAYYNNVEYHLIYSSKGPRVDCKDKDQIEFYNCAYGNQTNALRRNDEKSLYLLGLGEDFVQKVYFFDTDFDSTHDVICVNMVKL